MASLKIFIAMTCVFFAVMVRTGDAYSCYSGEGEAEDVTDTCETSGRGAACLKVIETESNGESMTMRTCVNGCGTGTIYYPDESMIEYQCCGSDLCNSSPTLGASIVLLITAALFHL